MAYYAFSSLEVSLGRGLWKMRTGVTPDAVDRALASIQAEVQRLRTEPVPAGELAGAKRNQIGGLALRLETNDGVGEAIREMAYWDLGLDHLDRYPALIEAITAEQIMETAARCSDPHESALAIAGPYQEQTGG